MPSFNILRKLPIPGLRGCFSKVPITSGSSAGFGSIYYTKSIVPLPMLSQSFSLLRSLEVEKRVTELRGWFVSLEHKTKVGVLGVWGSKIELPLTWATTY